MAINKTVVGALVLLSVVILARHTYTLGTNLAGIACKANFFENYTQALTVYGMKAKVTTNPFYQGNTTCSLECIIKVMKIQIQSLGVILAPDYMACSTGSHNKLQKKSTNYCYNGQCLTLAAINKIVANGTFF